jgi:predicted CXXCH cytochrome family protein
MKRLAVLIAVLALATIANAQYSNPQAVLTSMHNLSTSGTSTKRPKAVDFKEVCAFCHSPHQSLKNTDPLLNTGGALASEAPYDASGNTLSPLWNHALSVKASYPHYTTTTNNYLGVDTADLGMGATPVITSVQNSNLCLGCHDGSIGINTIFKGQLDPTGATRNRQSPAMNNTGGGINVATIIAGHKLGDDINRGLKAEHPVNFSYDDALTAGVVLKTRGVNVTTKRFGVPSTDGNGFMPLYGANNSVQCGSCHDVHDQEQYGYFLRASMDGSNLCLSCHGQ